MDFRSRDRYRQAVEELAEPTGDGQLRVALKAVERARQVAEKAPDARGAHVGYHLIGRGRRQFEKGVARDPGLRLRVRREFFRHATPGYLGSIAVGTAALVATAILYAYTRGWRGPSLALVALLALVPASELTIQLVQRIIGNLIPPRRLPRIDLDRVPASARTMVIVPTLLDSVERVEDLASHLEIQALGNLDPHIHFAILSDFADAVETRPRDADPRGGARIDAQRQARGGRRQSFFLFHRFRQWNEGRAVDGVGAQRGKIEEFNRLLRGATTRASPCRSATSRSCRRSATASPSTAIRACRALGASADRHHHAPAQSADVRSGGRPRHRGLRDPPAARQRHVHDAAGSLFARLYSGTPASSVYDRGLRHLPGPVRRRHLHRQGAL
jgi:cyclic beta-1,2-glucan synthetase